MDEHTPPNKPLNRLRAAAGIIPLIEAGLVDGRVSHERASLMAEFCLWSLDHGANGDAIADKLKAEIKQGLDRIQAKLSAS